MAQRSLFDIEPDPPDFDGVTYEPAKDKERLSNALSRVYDLMSDGNWRTLGEIARYADCSESGASARLRDLRKDKFKAMYPNGGMESKRVEGGLFFYRLLPEAT
jgi:hypothetical protein